jgi:hypothetical protein
MNHVDRLVQAGTKAGQARARVTQAERERDLVVRQANYHGGMSAREISGWVGISHQRVTQIINNDPITPPRLTLHKAILVVLEDFGLDWVPVHEVTRRINERQLYRRKDGQSLHPGQVRARVGKYADLFEGTTDGTNRIRLRRPPG